jgi:hypothetical protein
MKKEHLGGIEMKEKKVFFDRHSSVNRLLAKLFDKAYINLYYENVEPVLVFLRILRGLRASTIGVLFLKQAIERVFKKQVIFSDVEVLKDDGKEFKES